MTSTPPALPNPAWRDLTLTLEEVIRPLGRWMLYLAILTFVPYWLLWGWPSFTGLGSWPSLLGTMALYVMGFTGVYLVSAALHEGLHAFAMILWARVPLGSIRFGVRWREGVAYVHTSAPMTVQAYRWVLAVPGVVLGLLPTALGLALGSGLLTLYGYIMTASAIGDFMVFRLLCPFEGTLLVRDHPSEVGCQVQEAG